ncbi:hypothetical protein K6V92_22405 [Cupriavidus respiraculi]|uniref:hypothetical protein n=1 Tax=Cupriavidus respiraculi TaxID=195930 RepID=UPI001C9724D9|nr:hypothetical protein [Cupriavidus respiraculi]MBY4949362.1 hypothetical protein [Cupriavidus respiraculi]
MSVNIEYLSGQPDRPEARTCIATPAERAIHRRTTYRLSHANEFGGRRIADGNAIAARRGAHSRRGRAPRPEKFDPRIPFIVTARDMQPGVI